MTAESKIFAPGLLEGRVAIVTGGGTNLGRAAAEELVACGADVIIAGRREDVLTEAADAIGCGWVCGDIRDPESARAIVSAAIDRHGRLDTLVNNAGGQYFVPAESIVAKGWNAVQRLNIGGTLNMLEAASDALEPGGSVVNVTVSPHGGMPGMAHTGAARAAVEAIGKDYAARWANRPVAVMALAIGRFATTSLQKYPAAVMKAAGTSIPLQRLGTMDEFAWTVALLASPLGQRFTGSVVTLDGGLDNWSGKWPTDNMVEDDGSVPTEQRAPAPR